MKRCSAVIRHSYGKIEIDSKHQRDLLLKRVRAAESGFRETVEDAVLTAAETATGRSRSRWSKIRRKYNITVDNDPSDCRKLLKVAYQPEDEYEAQQVVQSIKNAYVVTHNDRGGAHGVHAVLQLVDGTQKRYKSLETKTIPPKRGSNAARKFRKAVESVTEEEWEMVAKGYRVT